MLQVVDNSGLLDVLPAYVVVTPPDSGSSKTPATVTLSNLTQTYTGSPLMPTATTDPAGLAPCQFVVCLQNHDQVANRAAGERLHHQVELAVFRAATVLVLSVPETPLLFMGEEYAETHPFQYFTSYGDPRLGQAVPLSASLAEIRAAPGADAEAV